MKSPAPARMAAFQVLRQVLNGGYASDLLRACSFGDPRDAALAEAIVFGCLRRQNQLDYRIEQLSGRKIASLDSEVRIALQMGLFQLQHMDRVPAHAVLDDSVELVKRARKRSAAGLVNAVLRKAQGAAFKDWPDEAREWAMPSWLLQRWQNHFGAQQARAMAFAALEEPVAAINPVTGRQQDIGAQSIVAFLEVQPGMRVLDLCAAPGNKTAQILAVTGNVVAGDRYLRRLADVPSEAQRIVLDATKPLPVGAVFDRILVDAPCSGTGTLSRNPEIKWRLKPGNLQEFQRTQKAILQNALNCLTPHGRLVYSTCSLEKEENQDVVEEFGVREWHYRLPGKDPGDGFFAAVIK